MGQATSVIPIEYMIKGSDGHDVFACPCSSACRRFALRKAVSGDFESDFDLFFLVAGCDSRSVRGT